MEDKTLDRSSIYYNPGTVTQSTRLEMYIYSLEDALLGKSNNVYNWSVNTSEANAVLSEISKLETARNNHISAYNRISHLLQIISDKDIGPSEASKAQAEMDVLNAQLLTEDEIKDIDQQLYQLKQLGVNYKVNIDINNNFRTLGFYSGVYNVSYKLVNDLVTNCFIDAISSDRKSIRVKLKNHTSSTARDSLRSFFGMIDYNKNPVYGNTDFYTEPAVNFFDDKQHSILNWVPVNDYTVLLKFYDSIPQEIEEKSDLRIIMPLTQPMTDKIILFPAPATTDVNILRPANYNIRNSFKKQKMNLTSWNDVVSSDYDLSTTLVNKYFGSNTDGIELNVDYRSFENFVFYSNAYDRLEVFKYKLGLIEGYNDSLAQLTGSITGPASSSVAFLNNITKYKTRRDDIINKFDGYEKYLYYESSSYESSSFGEFFPTTWPKTTNVAPYNLYRTTATESINWYDGITDSASLYDKNNLNSLVHTIPEHITEDSFSEKYTTFVSMVGHQMDTLWLYTKHMEMIKDRDESLYTGMSKDLVYNVLSSYGWDGINDMQYDDLWYYSLGTDESGSAILTGSLAASQSLEWISATSESIATGDTQKEIWKRILNNLPYLNKTKGTKEGVRALINCYGIPATELRIREYGGPEPLNNKSYYEYRKFAYALQIEPSCSIQVPSPANNGSIEFRFKTDCQDLPMVILQDDNIPQIGPNILRVGIDSNRSMSIESANGDATMDSIPVNDGEWWTFAMSYDVGGNYDFHLKRAQYSRITHAYSASIDIGDPFPFVDNSFFIGAGVLGEFSGSMQDFKMWSTSISEDTINNHTLAPTAYHGNTATASFDNLFFRLAMGTDTNTYNHSVTLEMDSQHPNYRNPETASYIGFPNKINYEPIEETYNQEWPDISSNRTISNKVRVETNVVTGSLYLDKRVETSAFDEYPPDNAKVGIYLSPTNEVDQDIAEFMGGIRIDDYIGSYENYYTNDYPELRDLRHKYLSQYQGRYNTMDYFRLLNYFNTSLFKQIKEILPSRAKAITGAVVEPHMLNRTKVGVIYSKPTAENFVKEVEIDTQEDFTTDAESNLFEPNYSFEKTERSQYYWYNILYVDGEPFRYENDDYLQQVIQVMYEESREIDYNVAHYIPPIPSSSTHAGSDGYVITTSVTGSSPEILNILPRPFSFVPQSVKNHTYIGCKITSTGFNVGSSDTPDGSPPLEFTETSELIMRTQNPNESGNLIVQ